MPYSLHMPRLLTIDEPGNAQALVLVFLGYTYLIFTIAMIFEHSAAAAPVFAILSVASFFGTKKGRIRLAARLISYGAVAAMLACALCGPSLLVYWRK
ncbi:MAG TPA: hypothetical protein VGL89_13945 [Candidatus Koribacter sp.]|jgi:hypothetical protein